MTWLGRSWVLLFVVAACGPKVDDDVSVGSGDGSGESEGEGEGEGEAEGEAEGEVEGEGTHEDDGAVPGCSDEETPPDCWDQGPGECSDAAQPATCDGIEWVCPPGWALGGFGDGCEWPSPEGATLESSSSDGSTGTSTGTDTGGSDTGTSTGEVDDATFTAG